MMPLLLELDLNPSIPWPITGSWLLGLIGCAGVVYLALAIANQARKLFGRQPPLEEHLDRRDELLREEIKAGDAQLNERMDKIDERFIDLQADRQRTVKELTEAIHLVATDVAFIRGQFTDGARPHNPRQSI